MEELATTGKYWDIMINLTPGASYTLVVEATNNYGKKKLIVCEPFVTDIPPYTGELIIGKYGMSYAASAEGNTYRRKQHRIFREGFRRRGRHPMVRNL